VERTLLRFRKRETSNANNSREAKKKSKAMKKRRMFFFERLMYVDGHTPVNCIMTARISGDIAVDDLQLALKKVQGKHPLLRANVVEEDGELYLSFMENPPNIPVRIVERNSGEQWRNVTVAEWKTPFNMQEGPLIRMVWIKSEGVSELMLIGHHCVCDGTSLLTIFREILQVADEPDVQLTPYPPFESVRELFPKDVLSDWKMALLVTAKAALFRLFAFTVKAVHTAPPGEPYLIFWRASEKESAALAHRCKVEGTTPYAAMCVAFLSAFRQVNSARFKNRIMCPVDVRRFINKIRADVMFNYAPPIPLRIDPRIDPRTGFWDLARRLKQSMSEKISRLNAYEHLMVAEKLQTTIPKVISFLRRSKGSYDFAFSNVGRLDMPSNYQTFRVESLLGVTVAVPWRNATTLITTHFRGHTDIALVSNDGFLPYEEAVAIKETAVNLLIEATAVPEVVERRMAVNY
jgi:NRPS condensation-like uncharacterized protein